MGTYSFDDDPPLHAIRTERIPNDSWIPAGMEKLPPGWVNVRIWSYDETLNRDLYVTDECPGILHFESSITETVLQEADPDDNLFTEYGDPWDAHPVVVDTHRVDPPHEHEQFADPEWKPAYLGGGYLGSCPEIMVRKVLAEHGFAEAIRRPEGWRHPDDDGDPT